MKKPTTACFALLSVAAVVGGGAGCSEELTPRAVGAADIAFFSLLDGATRPADGDTDVPTNAHLFAQVFSIDAAIFAVIDGEEVRANGTVTDGLAEIVLPPLPADSAVELHVYADFDQNGQPDDPSTPGRIIRFSTGSEALAEPPASPTVDVTTAPNLSLNTTDTTFRGTYPRDVVALKLALRDAQGLTTTRQVAFASTAGIDYALLDTNEQAGKVSYVLSYVDIAGQESEEAIELVDLGLAGSCASGPSAPAVGVLGAIVLALGRRRRR